MEIYFRPAVKPLLLLLSAISVHLSLSPPNPPVKQDELYWRSASAGTTLFEKFVQSITFCSKSMVWIGVATEILTPIVTSGRRNWLFSSSCSSKPTPFDPTSPRHYYFDCHPLLITGALLTVLAASLRIWCFKKLGPLFTFEITIRPKHELVTSGPYSWVRHPSYTGVYLTLIGATLLLCAPKSWLVARGVWTPPGCLFGLLWLAKCALAFRGTYVRLTTEDQVLRETFGVEWEEYAARVPWRLLPGVF